VRRLSPLGKICGVIFLGVVLMVVGFMVVVAGLARAEDLPEIHQPPISIETWGGPGVRWLGHPVVTMAYEYDAGGGWTDEDVEIGLREDGVVVWREAQ